MTKILSVLSVFALIAMAAPQSFAQETKAEPTMQATGGDHAEGAEKCHGKDCKSKKGHKKAKKKNK